MVVITRETGKKRETAEALTGYFQTHLKISTRMKKNKCGKNSEMITGILILYE